MTTQKPRNQKEDAKVRERKREKGENLLLCLQRRIEFLNRKKKRVGVGSSTCNYIKMMRKATKIR